MGGAGGGGEERDGRPRMKAEPRVLVLVGSSSPMHASLTDVTLSVSSGNQNFSMSHKEPPPRMVLSHAVTNDRQGHERRV